MKIGQEMLKLNVVATRFPLFAVMVVMAVGLLWSANAQALPHGQNGYQQARSHSQTRGNIGSILSNIFSGRVAVSHEREGSSEGNTNVHERISRLVSMGGKIWEHYVLPRIERIHDGPRPTTPVPEPQAAMLFAVGIGIVAARRRL